MRACIHENVYELLRSSIWNILYDNSAQSVSLFIDEEIWNMVNDCISDSYENFRQALILKFN